MFTNIQISSQFAGKTQQTMNFNTFKYCSGEILLFLVSIKFLHINGHCILEAFTSSCFIAVRHPTACGQIGSFGTIEAVVKAGVITVRGSYHELAGFLDNA